MNKIKVMVPSGMMGVGFVEEAFDNGIKNMPDVLATDAGSTDPGPYYLGAGVAKYSESALKFELRKLMLARNQLNIPLIIGSCGTSGADKGVDLMAKLALEVAEEFGQVLKIGCIYSEQSAQAVEDAYQAGAISPLSPSQELDENTIRQCCRIVAVMGVEPIIHALEQGCDIILAGRSTDTAVMAALPIYKGVEPGPAWHAAKILECGAQCTTKPSTRVVMAEIDSEGFTICPMGNGATATPRSVHAHMLYENSNPNVLVEPGGTLDVSDAIYKSIDGKNVRVTGSKWIPTEKYTVKLEGAKLAGYQAVSMCVIREPEYVRRFDEWILSFEAFAHQSIRKVMELAESDYTLDIRCIGKNAVLGTMEREVTDHIEIGVMAVVTTPDAIRTKEIISLLNAPFLHFALPDAQKTPTHALPFSPSTMDRGLVYEFVMNHVMAVDDPLAPFRFSYIDVKGK